MKEYFEHDRESTDSDVKFLKKSYDMADAIFERRFEEAKTKGQKSQTAREKAEELQALINKVNKRKLEKELDTKMTALVLGNAYLRLAQCQNEIFEKSSENYRRARNCLEEHIDYSRKTEIDLLLMLNKGKYFRNTAEIGKKRDYDRAKTIFGDVLNSVEDVEISEEKRLHLYLDARINVGRVSRYGYEFQEAKEIFLSMLLALQEYVDSEKKALILNCSSIKCILKEGRPDDTLVRYAEQVPKLEDCSFLMEYLLQALIHIGILYRKQKNYQNAMEIFELILQIDGENIDALNNQGICCRKIGDALGKWTPKGQAKYKDARVIFENLDKRGNKFAHLNLYKCKLNESEEKCTEAIGELEQECEKSDNAHFRFVLGRCYEQIRNYDKALECFEMVYEKKHYIARGGMGFKAYYNVAQCKIRKGEFRQAREILSEIRENLKKSHNYTDILTEVDYGWCLMQEGRYRRAIEVYQQLLQAPDLGEKQKLESNNNLAACYVYLGKPEEAWPYLDEVLKIDEKNSMALYLQGNILLNSLQRAELTNAENRREEDYSKAFELFDGLMHRKSVEKGINSGWLISAIMWYKRKQDEKLKKNIVTKIKYSADPISMKAFLCLADFVLGEMEADAEENSLCRDFCHMKLNENGENEAFQIFMESPEFHYFERRDRAFLLAQMVQMYEGVLEIKDACRLPNDTWEIPKDLPYHYTKLKTLKSLLIQSDQAEPHLRLWNSAYMNDAYEGRIFSEFLRQTAISAEGSKGREKEIEEKLEKYVGNPEDSSVQIDSNVYITSFSSAEDSFQMWSIYGDCEKGAAIRFSEDFYDIRDKRQNTILDEEGNEYALYRVNYFDEKDFESQEAFASSLRKIWSHIDEIEKKLEEIRERKKQKEPDLFYAAETLVRTFLADRLNEVRFLFKSPSYEYEEELRFVRCSQKPMIDEVNFTIPRLYIEVHRKIENLEVRIGSKMEKQEIKDTFVWLKNSGKVKNIQVSRLN